MIDRKQAMTERVRADLHDHLEDFKKHGGTYIEEYIEAVLSGKQSRPRRPFHPKLAEFVRELVLDAGAVERRGTCGTATPDLSLTAPKTFGRGGVIAQGQSSRKKVAA